MKKKWLVLLIVLSLVYFDNIKHISHGELHFSSTPGTDFLLLLYHLTLFLIVNYLLIPNFFYKKKFVLFFASLFGLVILYSFLEEELIEKILDPTGKGNNDFNWSSIYFFLQENMVPLLAFMSIQFVFDSFEKERQLEQIEKNSLTNELKFLKSQIQPHILFNSLNSLYDYTLSKSDKAPELVLQLSNVLRYILYETSDKLVPLAKELIFVEDYVALQKMQLEGRGKVQLDINNPPKLSLKIAPFLLIPFIENSFKHSLSSKEKGIAIIIKIKVEEQKIHLFVSNNFESESSNTESLLTSGIGLKNVQKRLMLLYPNQHQLHLEEGKNLYKMKLELELSA